MDRYTGHRDITGCRDVMEIMLKKELNYNQSINKSIKLSINQSFNQSKNARQLICNLEMEN